jgi:hemerythrin superfamily protein
MFTAVTTAAGEEKSRRFDELRALLAVHETAEEMVLRPVTRETAGDSVAEARMHEESEATQVLAELEKMDISSADFNRTLSSFEKAVSEHAENEETEEFPAILARCDEDKRASMGKQVLAAEAIAPTHPHPSAAGSTTAQFVAGPFASLVDRTRDAIKKAAG